MMKFKKHTYKTWMAALLLGMATLPSCEQESLVTTLEEAATNTLSLKLFCSESNESRSADDTNNEDAIHRLDIFLYPKTATFDTKAVYQETIDNLSSNESHTVSLDLTNDEIETLFGTTETTCMIYAIANRPDGTVWKNGETSVNQLKALTITAAFNSFNAVNGISVYQPQADFVMDSDFIIDGNNDKVTLNRDNHTLSGTVPLFRAASKISLVITQVKDVPLTDADGNVQKDEQDNDIIWTANTSGMLVRLHDGVFKSHIDNSVQPYTVQKKTETANGDYFSFTNGQEVKMTSVESDWKNIPAFYSYSSDWSTGTDEEPYLTLIVPWARSDEKNADGKPYYQNTYYQVPISTIAKSLVRNTHYKINLVVSRLGSFVEEKPEVISPSSYIIVPWQSETVNADLMDYRYLMVEEKDITIYNEDELYIPYVTSHEAYILPSSIKFYQQDITGADPEWNEINSTNSNYFANLELVGINGVKQIYYKNVLDNVYTSSTFDFTPYKVTFTIQHKDNPDYKEEVTIIQYPAIYGEADRNSDYKNASTASGNNSNHGYVYVNGYYSTSQSSHSNLSTQDFFASAPGYSSMSASPNMYVFTVTSIYGTDYVVGDPRENSISEIVDDTREYNSSSNTATAWIQAPALFDGTSNRGLKYYYGTDVDMTSNTTLENSRTRNVIAPKFRIASSYGVLHTGSEPSYDLEGMKKRCASYQEDGYPAGRWRLPTEAEFRFIISQVNKGTLPEIYYDETTYWCAHGLGIPHENGTVTMGYYTTTENLGNNNQFAGGHSTRCVYDEWYWGSGQLENKSQFTWGDQPR